MGHLRLSMAETVKRVRSVLCDNTDAIIHGFRFGQGGQVRASLIYMEGLANRDALHKSILQPLVHEAPHDAHDTIDYRDPVDIEVRLLSVTDVTLVPTLQGLLDHLMTGSTILVVDGSPRVLAINLRRLFSSPSPPGIKMYRFPLYLRRFS